MNKVEVYSRFKKRRQGPRVSVNGYTVIQHGSSGCSSFSADVLDDWEDMRLLESLLDEYPKDAAIKIYELEKQKRQMEYENSALDWELEEVREQNSNYFEALLHVHTHILTGAGGDILEGTDKSYRWVLEPIHKLLVEHSKKAVKDNRREIAVLAAKTRHKKSQENKDKACVKEQWSKWQENPEMYASKAAFSRDMTKRYGFNNRVVERWCKQWEEGATLLA